MLEDESVSKVQNTVIKNMCNDYKVPDIDDDEEIKEKLDANKNIDMVIGQSEFQNSFEKYVYDETLKYFDATGFSDIIMDTAEYIYEHPCSAADARIVFETAFASSGAEAPTGGVIAINVEIHDCSLRIENHSNEIKRLLNILLFELDRRRIFYPESICFRNLNSKHLLDMFEIDEKDFTETRPSIVEPTDDIDSDETIEDIVYFVEPGCSKLKYSFNKEDWECIFNLDKFKNLTLNDDVIYKIEAFIAFLNLVLKEHIAFKEGELFGEYGEGGEDVITIEDVIKL